MNSAFLQCATNHELVELSEKTNGLNLGTACDWASLDPGTDTVILGC